MNQFKKLQVIMLRTREDSMLSKAYLANPSYLRFNKNGFKDDSFLSNDNQHLHITSDDKIEEDDWCYDKTNHRIVKFIHTIPGTKNHCFVSSVISNKLETAKKGYSIDRCDLMKIIATTDISLNYIKHDDTVPYPKGKQIILPQPSQQFIEKYIESYNKGEVITNVLVEYTKATYDKWFNNGGQPVFDTLKINPKDNTITIKKLKDSWNREEVENILYKHTEMMLSGYRDTLDNWIKENL